MLKKILILVLILNTSYTLPFEPSSNQKSDLAVSCVCVVSGMICTWLAYKGFKKSMQSMEERDKQLKILNEMSQKVYKKSTWKYVEWMSSFVGKEQYSMNIPSRFSQEQEEEANRHWSLFSSNNKYADKMMSLATLAGLGSLVLTPLGMVGILNAFGLDF